MKPWDRLKMYFLLDMGYSIAMLAYQRVWFSILHPQPLIFQFSMPQNVFLFLFLNPQHQQPAAGKGFWVLFVVKFPNKVSTSFKNDRWKELRASCRICTYFEKYYVGEICGSEIGDSTVDEPQFWKNHENQHIQDDNLGGSSNIDVEKEPWKASTHLINISWNMFKMGIFPNFWGEITTFELHQNRHTETRMRLVGFARGKKWRPHRLGYQNSPFMSYSFWNY